MQTITVTTDLLTIECLLDGPTEGPPVLLLHGWPDDATTWIPTMKILAGKGYRCVAPWLRGFGGTVFRDEATPRTGNSGILALDAIALLDQLQIRQPVSIIGHDWGSNIAEALAVGWPERVARMSQLSSPPRLGGQPTPPFSHAQLEWYHWFQATKRGARAVAADPIGFAKIMWDNWSPSGWYSEEEFAATARSWENPDWVAVTLHSYRSRWDEAEPDPRSAELEAKIKATQTLSLPALYVQGGVDGVNPPRVSEKVHEKFSGPFNRIVMEGVGHFPMREAPEILANHLLPFLA